MGKWFKSDFFLSAVNYFGIHPAPENAPGYAISGVTITMIRAIIGTSIFFNSFEWTKKFGLFIGRLTAHPTPCIASVNREIVDLGNFKIHIFTPKSYQGNHGGIIAFHGGGYTMGNVDFMATFYSNMAQEINTVVIAVDYRLIPEHPFPAALDDAIFTVKYVYENSKNLKIDFSKTIMTGDSAGGHLTLVTALSLLNTKYQVAGIFPVHPVTQGVTANFRSHYSESKYLLSRFHFAFFLSQLLTGSGKMVDYWLSGKVLNACLARSSHVTSMMKLDNQIDKKAMIVEFMEPLEEFDDIVTRVLDYKISPLFAPLEMIKALPITVIYVGENDILRDEGILMFKIMKNQKHPQVKLVEWARLVHDGIVLSRQWRGLEIIPEISNLVDEYFKDMKMVTD